MFRWSVLDVCYPSQFGYSEARPQGLRMSRIPATSQDGCHWLPEFGGFRFGAIAPRIACRLAGVWLVPGCGFWMNRPGWCLRRLADSRGGSVVFSSILCPLILVGIIYRLRPTGK